MPPKVTLVAPVRFVPVIVTLVPPAMGPLAGARLVIVGGALYMGRWHTHAVALLERHHEALSGVPLAVFAMGPRTLEDDDVATSRDQVDGALASLAVEPFSVTIFGGVIDPAKLRFPFSRMEAVDARDHTAIQGWARDVLHTALSTSSA